MNKNCDKTLYDINTGVCIMNYYWLREALRSKFNSLLNLMEGYLGEWRNSLDLQEFVTRNQQFALAFSRSSMFPYTVIPVFYIKIV